MDDSRLDKIHIRDLRVRCIIGTRPEERDKPQGLEISITLHADLRAAGRSDAIEDTVDYNAITLKVVEQVEASEFCLLERLAQHVAEICLAEPTVQRVCVLVAKPAALRLARTVGVEIVRDRQKDV